MRYGQTRAEDVVLFVMKRWEMKRMTGDSLR